MRGEAPGERVERLRALYPTFVYEACSFREGASRVDCRFRFRTGDISFEPTCTFVFAGEERRRVPREVIDNLVFHAGLAEIPSYWKATCSPRIEVQAGALSPEQSAFWTWVLTEGMSEFHFVNQTRFTEPDFVHIRGEGAHHPRFEDQLADGHVIPIGGGKDSLVTLDVLGRRPEPITTLAINPPPSTGRALDIAGVAERVAVERRIDPRLFELNGAGYANGHTPFGVVVAMVSAFAAVMCGRKHVTLSNESSSDVPTRIAGGRPVNHQVGKSAELEALLHRYLAAHVAPELHYFSLLRPFNELQIAQRLSEMTTFHPVLRSCNRGRKTDTWCGDCPKCLSTFIVLAPFVERAALTRMFGKDLLLDEACRARLPSLLGEGERPFECVATPDELRVALALRHQQAGDHVIDVLTHRAPAPLVPEDLYAAADALLRPRITPLLGTLPVVVLGLGIEGASTCRHLTSTVERLDLTVVDDVPSVADKLPPGARFLSTEELLRDGPKDAVVFKSPGVPSDHRALRGPVIVTSNTELFFERCAGTIVGVTGTKGKSTATSLIAHVLRGAGIDTRLVGNIGEACLDAGGDSDTVYCVELSSFQLEDLKVSPHIAVVLGVFADHLDRYDDMASYVAAKSSITRYQGRGDVVFYNRDCPRATAVAELSVGERVAFRRERPTMLGDATGPLLGTFNDVNLWPAIHVGRRFGIDDAALARSVRTFRPLEGRLDTVAEKEGIRFVCDIRSTAPEVTMAALEALAESKNSVEFLFLGGVDRRQDYSPLAAALARSTVRHVVLFPPTGARIREVLTPLAGRLAFFEPRSMEEAVHYVYREASPSSVCLMSTAAPSNGGLFSGPEDKARQFTRWARELGRRS
jgi:UDP-N-acetylmuramoylalanine--D-glutamate ligase